MGLTRPYKALQGLTRPYTGLQALLLTGLETRLPASRPVNSTQNRLMGQGARGLAGITKDKVLKSMFPR